VHYARNYGLIGEFIAEYEDEYQTKKSVVKKRQSHLLDIIYTLRDTMTYQQTLESVAMFLLAGFDTVGKVMSSVLLLLAMNPKEQEKVYAEVSSILSSESEEIDEEKLGKFVYIDLVIKESLRLIPQALVIVREATEDVKLSEIHLNQQWI
jgi:cytochrome P450